MTEQEESALYETDDGAGGAVGIGCVLMIAIIVAFIIMFFIVADPKDDNLETPPRPGFPGASK